MLPSYPRVYNLGHPELSGLFDGPVVVQEKVDGSQFSFGLIDGELRMRSKGAEVFPDNPGMFALAVESVLERKGKLVPGLVYRGEFLSKPKHNTLAYDRVPNGNIILFDVEDVTKGPQNFFNVDSISRYATAAIGYEAVPRLFIDPNPDAIKEAMGTLSVLGGSKIEGLVFKNYARFGRDGKVLMGKHVSEAFKEVHRKDWKERNPAGVDIVERLGMGLNTTARWDKAVQHLRERGDLTTSPKDIGPLLKEVNVDILEEEKQAIQEALFKWAWPKLSRLSTRGLPEWYKQKLMEEQFNE